MAADGKRHLVVGTAGHIDHGKTSLVKALTGVATDRLPEEKKRGITIELGFARWDLADDLVCSIIDVPGHEKFVRTMVAGAAGVDAVVLVVAGDDAVMPQTQEHLAVCSLLGVNRGVVALTKCDLIDSEMRELVELDIAEAMVGTFLEGAPIVPVSSMTGEGLDALKAALEGILRKGADTSESVAQAAYLGVDRVFTRPGFGTVVTGTLLGGPLAEDDAVDLLPGLRTERLQGAKVRGLEVHGEKVKVAHAGRRVAVNLRGVEAEDIVRGSILCAANSRAPTSAVHVELTLLSSAPPVKERDELSFHLSTVDQLVKVVPLNAKEIGPGETAFARLKADAPFFAFPHARFVVRKPGLHGQGTVGGGRVLDPHPSEGKGAFARWKASIAGLASPTLDDNVRALLEDARNEGLSLAALTARLSSAHTATEIERAATAVGVRLLVQKEERYVDRARVQDVASDILEMIEVFHAEHPIAFGPELAFFEGQLKGQRSRLAAAALAVLEEQNAIVREGAVVQRKGFQPDATPIEAVARVFVEGGRTPPTDDEALRSSGLPASAFADALTELKRQERLARVGELHFDTSTLFEVARQVVAYFESNERLSTGAFKEVAAKEADASEANGGISRKFAIPLLEWLDKEGVTKRDGDSRVPGSQVGAPRFAPQSAS